MLIGHQSLLSFFKQAIERNSLGHAYCLVGQSQVGKRTVARFLATQMLHVNEARLDTYPDFFFIERIVDEKTGKRKKEITVDQARSLKIRLQSTSWTKGYRIVIIDEVEFMNEEAGNALLKLLEEPPRGTIFFLLTVNDQVLLPTIRSRVQLIQMGLVSHVDLIQGLKERGISDLKAQELARLSWGRPGRALELFQNPELLKETQEHVQRLERLVTQPLYERFKIIEELCGGKKEESVSREKLDAVLELWMMWWRERLVETQPYKVATIIQELYQARQLLQRNIHPRLLLENVVMQFTSHFEKNTKV